MKRGAREEVGQNGWNRQRKIGQRQGTQDETRRTQKAGNEANHYNMSDTNEGNTDRRLKIWQQNLN